MLLLIYNEREVSSATVATGAAPRGRAVCHPIKVLTPPSKGFLDQKMDFLLKTVCFMLVFPHQC